MGIILNRRTQVPASRVFEDWKEAKGHSEPVFLGGPVERMGALALLRSRASLDKAHRVLGDVHATSDQRLLGKQLAAGAPPERFRIYLGYAGWAPDQLDNEIDLGAWHVFPGTPDLVFDREPETLWDRLIRKTDMRIARL
jgi:putative transcriptional regulator